jgi:2C-methyl-D-erythritol 2,4-cyclodiphosphate synthase
VLHVDVSVLLERPKLAPHKAAIRDALAGALGVAPTASTSRRRPASGSASSGREEGVAALAVATLRAPD